MRRDISEAVIIMGACGHLTKSFSIETLHVLRLGGVGSCCIQDDENVDLCSSVYDVNQATFERYSSERYSILELVFDSEVRLFRWWSLKQA